MEARVKRAVNANLQDFVGGFCRTHHRGGIRQFRRHRFLAEYMLARVQRRHRRPAMPLVIRADAHRINAVHLQHLVVSGEDVLFRDTPFLGGLPCLTLDNITHRDDFKTAGFFVGSLVRTRNATRANDTYSDSHVIISFFG